MRSKLIFSLLGIIMSLNLISQDMRTILTIDDDEITVDEFMHIYGKNNDQVAQDDQKSIEDYMELFINFKLKVKEAESLGMDTVSSFVSELAGYRKQLAEPYFTNDEIISELVKEAYDRMQTDLRASHILIKVGPNAMPEDTLAAYERAMEAREAIMSGQSFDEVAIEYSEDPSAKERPGRGGRMIPGNKGDLGYFTALNMVYPFENAAYRLKVGEVSMPVRTDFGYHIIKLTDKVDAMGDIEVAHIFVQVNDTMSDEMLAEKEALINSLYEKLEAGESFVDLVTEYSDDKGSALNGGKLPVFQSNRMVPTFIETISALKDSGDYSRPVRTSYGFHIIELHGKSGIMPFEEEQMNLEKRIKKDARAQKSEQLMIDDIKKDNGFEQFDDNLDVIYSSVDSAIYERKWEIPLGINFSKTLFTIGEEKYSQLDFARYLKQNQRITKEESISEFINKKFKEFITMSCMAYEDVRLEEKHPEFKALMNEYRGGILLFDLTEEKVWSKASRDTLGLKAFYEENKDNYFWGERLDASMYFVNDENFVDQALEMVKNGKSSEEVMAEINNDSTLIVNTRSGKFSKNDHKLIDKIAWEEGISEVQDHNLKKAFVDVHAVLPPQQKTLDEARGMVIAGYQEYLEDEWIKELRAKYDVKVNKKVLKSLAQ